jgi:hypothetical protein
MFAVECRRAGVSPEGRLFSPELEKVVRRRREERDG